MDDASSSAAGWNEASYNFLDFDAQPPFQRSAAFGIRLMQEIEPSVDEAAAPIPTLARDFTKEMPADAATFDDHPQPVRVRPARR